MLAIIATGYICFSITNNSRVVDINKSEEQTLCEQPKTEFGFDLMTKGVKKINI